MSNFRKDITNPFKFLLFKLTKLPLAYIAGLKITKLTDEECTVTTKHNYLTKNPFKSMYFAVQAMAAELSTGALVLDQLSRQDVKISMLVGTFKADYSKKATGKIAFTCPDGSKLDEVVQKVVATNEGYTVDLISIGVDEVGDVVSTTTVTWTLKKKPVRK